jgi:hypothetical protein
MKEPERRQFRQEVVFSAKYFHEHNFVNFIADTVGWVAFFERHHASIKKAGSFRCLPCILLFAFL